MTIFFDRPETRRQFLSDLEGLIVYHDQNYREGDERMNYEDTLSFFMPDLAQDPSDSEKESFPRMNLFSADMAVNPNRYFHFVNQATW